MAGARFATTRDLIASFPTAAVDVGEEGSDEGALPFVRRCMDEDREDSALSFCAYLLQRREAIWWCHGGLSAVPDLAPLERAHLDLVHAWAVKPEEARRRGCLDKGLESSPKLPTTWLLLAVGWSGGSIAPPQAPPIQASPSQTPQAVRVALLAARSRLAADRRKGIVKSWVGLAVKMVEVGGDFR